MNFESAVQRNSFFYVLKELGYVLFFMLLVCTAAYFLLGLNQSKSEQFACNAETVRKNKGLKSFYQNGTYFTGGKMQTDKFALYGEHSMELTKDDAFGFEFEWPYLRGNETFTVSVWRFSNGKDSRRGIIVASAKGMWKSGEEVVEKSDSGWEKIQFEFTPPPESKNQTLKIYCWNNGHEPIYFDDLSIQIQREEPL